MPTAPQPTASVAAWCSRLDLGRLLNCAWKQRPLPAVGVGTSGAHQLHPMMLHPWLDRLWVTSWGKVMETEGLRRCRQQVRTESGETCLCLARALVATAGDTGVLTRVVGGWVGGLEIACQISLQSCARASRLEAHPLQPLVPAPGSQMEEVPLMQDPLR